MLELETGRLPHSLKNVSYPGSAQRVEARHKLVLGSGFLFNVLFRLCVLVSLRCILVVQNEVILST